MGAKGEEAMPGRLIMDQQGAMGSRDLKKDRAQAQEANLPPKPDFAQKQTAPPVSAPDNHVANGALPNGAPDHPQHLPTMNGDVVGETAATSDLQSPPPLDQSWRDTHPGNKSVGTLIERLAQACFEDLNSTLTKMADTPGGTSNGQPNGVTPQSVDPSEASLTKKRTFMEFANGQRDRFIKTLVLSDWARKSEEMNRLVDIKVYFDRQNGLQRHAIDFIGHVKHDVHHAKVPNPNIDLAMELLATGKASKSPHFGYIAPKKLTAKETLKTLRNMNVLLETRLNLHEELPPHFNEFSVANGKATFIVPGEFEVDLAIADEELTSQFYFINLRFLFSPSPGEIQDGLRFQLEPRTNDVLGTKGLRGCYEFLHNFVLTHKINTLYDQARQIERERWFGCVSIQKSRRVLTLQYWREVPGRKNWIEIAVSTGKHQGRRSRRPPTPQLSVRWFRRGELVQEHGMEFEWKSLDLERILCTVLAKHVSWALSAIREKLQVLAGASSKLKVLMHSPGDIPEDSCLKLSLPGMQIPLVVKLETTTGHVSISPATPRTADTEARLRKQSDADIAVAVANLLCNTLKDRVDKAAELAAWSPLREPIRTDNLKTMFGTDVPSWRAYIPNRGWTSQGSQWALLPIFSLAGERWWTVRLESRRNPSGNPHAKTIVTAREVPVYDIVAADTAPTMSRSLLLQIEKLAAAEVSFAVLSQQLSSEKIPHRVQKTASLTGHDSAVTEMFPTSAMLIQARGLIKTPTGKDSPIDSIKITNQGFIAQGLESDDKAEMGHELRLTVEYGRLKFLRAYLSKTRRNADIAMNESGGLALRLRTPFAQPFFEQAKELLKTCERLDTYLAFLYILKMKAVLVTTTKLTFVYNQTPEYTAVLSFRGNSDSHATLKLEPAGSNPQQRLRMSLEKLFNTPTVANSFCVLCHCLQSTLPVMQLFEKLETADSSGHQVAIIIRNAMTYRIDYKAPLPAWSFHIEFKIKRADNGKFVSVWRIGPDKASTPGDVGSSAFGRALLDLAKHKDDKWQGLEDGTLVAQMHGAASALESLDKLVRNFQGSDDIAMKQEDGKSIQQPSASAPAQQKPASNNNTSTQKSAPSKTNANANTGAARNNQSKVKKEIIELD